MQKRRSCLSPSHDPRATRLRALVLAEYEVIDDGEYCATVPGLCGVIGTGKAIEECRANLIEAIEEWIALRLRLGLLIPSIGGRTIEVSTEPKVAAQTHSPSESPRS